jgi:hypothetical protein
MTAVCSAVQTKHINTLCGQSTEFLMLRLNACVATTGLERINLASTTRIKKNVAGVVVRVIAERYYQDLQAQSLWPSSSDSVTACLFANRIV